jgi:NitT/TauT family transport system ATP-binding protein
MADIEVALPRPRDPGMARTADFARLTDAVFAELTRGMAEAQTPQAAQ